MLKAILYTLGTSLLPVLEIRAAIPVGIESGLSPVFAYLLGLAGNMLPIPFLILLTRKVINWLKEHNILVRFTAWLERKGEEKAKRVKEYSFWGLVILVAIPLPGTGAWTGALVASLLNMRLKDALPAILLGVIIAGLVVLAAYYGVVSVGSLA